MSAFQEGQTNGWAQAHGGFMPRPLMVAVGVLLGSEALLAQGQLSDAVKSFVRVDAPLVALEHVRVIDGTGAPLPKTKPW